MPSNRDVLRIWDEVLVEMCDCFADENGNRACDRDDNCPCSRCENPSVTAEFLHRLRKGENK